MEIHNVKSSVEQIPFFHLQSYRYSLTFILMTLFFFIEPIERIYVAYLTNDLHFFNTSNIKNYFEI